jgi:hypothetical protein
VIEQILLDQLQTVTTYAREHEADFIELITKKSQSELDRSLRDGKRELEQAQAVFASWTRLSSGFMRTMLKAKFPMSVLRR